MITLLDTLDLILLRSANAERKGFNFVLFYTAVYNSSNMSVKENSFNFIDTTRYCEECDFYIFKQRGRILDCQFSGGKEQGFGSN